jgi:hypothetical protein
MAGRGAEGCAGGCVGGHIGCDTEGLITVNHCPRMGRDKEERLGLNVLEVGG